MHLTFWLVYGAILLGFQWLLPHTHSTRLWIAGGFLLLLFIGNARTDREYLSTYVVDTVDGQPGYTISIPHVGILSNLNFFSPNTVQSQAKVIVQLLFIGPRLVTRSWKMVRRTRELTTFDPAISARMVKQLRQRDGRVPFSQLQPSFSEDEAETALRELRELDAIQFLDSSPAGVMLTSAFRERLSEAVGGAE